MNDEFRAKQMEAFVEYINSDDSSDIDFDLYAQDPNDWSWLREFIPGLVISSAGGLLPFQAEGLLDGHPFYYRERGGMASLRIGAMDDSMPYDLGTSLFSSSVEVEEFRSGPGWVSTLMTLIEKLSKTPFRYEFPSKKLDHTGEMNFVATDVEETTCGWGHTVEEAFETTKETSVYLLEHGFDEDKQNEMWILREISPIPINEDTREFVAYSPEVRVPEVWRSSNGAVEIPDDFWSER